MAIIFVKLFLCILVTSTGSFDSIWDVGFTDIPYLFPTDNKSIKRNRRSKKLQRLNLLVDNKISITFC
jgi:hypothetical protein